MLSSIHPLGERTRNNRWWLTAAAFAIGATVGGAALGLVLGLVAMPVGALFEVEVRWLIMGLAALVGTIVDLRLAGRALPSWHRQVNEDWLGRYRGWVYGLGFGFQLGSGLVVYVTTALTYVMLVGAVATGSFTGAVIVATVFGVGRGALVLTTWRIRTPDDLRRFHAHRDRVAAPVRVAGGLVLAASAGIALVVAW